MLKNSKKVGIAPLANAHHPLGPPHCFPHRYEVESRHQEQLKLAIIKLAVKIPYTSIYKTNSQLIFIVSINF